MSAIWRKVTATSSCRTRSRASIARAVRVGMEVRVSVAQALHRSEDRRDPAPPRVRELPDPRHEGGGARGADSQARELPCAAPFVRYAPARGGLRHTYGARAARPQAPRDDAAPHPTYEHSPQTPT